MSLTETVIAGTLKADGTLVLDEKPNLPPGRVQVQVQSVVVPAKEDWWQFLQRCRAELEASGATFRRGVDIAAEVEQIRGEHDRVESIYWEQEWEKHHPGDGSC